MKECSESMKGFTEVLEKCKLTEAELRTVKKDREKEFMEICIERGKVKLLDIEVREKDEKIESLHKALKEADKEMVELHKDLDEAIEGEEQVEKDLAEANGYSDKHTRLACGLRIWTGMARSPSLRQACAKLAKGIGNKQKSIEECKKNHGKEVAANKKSVDEHKKIQHTLLDLVKDRDGQVSELAKGAAAKQKSLEEHDEKAQKKPRDMVKAREDYIANLQNKGYIYNAYDICAADLADHKAKNKGLGQVIWDKNKEITSLTEKIAGADRLKTLFMERAKIDKEGIAALKKSLASVEGLLQSQQGLEDRKKEIDLMARNAERSKAVLEEIRDMREENERLEETRDVEIVARDEKIRVMEKLAAIDQEDLKNAKLQITVSNRFRGEHGWKRGKYHDFIIKIRALLAEIQLKNEKMLVKDIEQRELVMDKQTLRSKLEELRWKKKIIEGAVRDKSVKIDELTKVMAFCKQKLKGGKIAGT